MAAFEQMDRTELQSELDRLKEEYAQFKAKGLSLNMARGKPSAEQLDLSLPLLSCISSAQDCIAEDGTDCRNYGVLDGLPEAKRLMATMLDDAPENVIVGGNSSLTLMAMPSRDASTSAPSAANPGRSIRESSGSAPFLVTTVTSASRNRSASR